MTTLFSILAQTRTGAVIEIIVLLLVAGVIGFLTAYLYYKPIYTRKINELEEEKLKLEGKVSNLDVEVSELNTRIKDLEKKLEEKKDKKEK